jgi:triacylglycerol lipase
MARQHVLLAPGFFGFANLGDFAYFGHVREFLTNWWKRAGVEGEVHVVATHPTASLTRRAARLLETLAELDAGDDVFHLIGHSSGGLDVRLMTSPGVSLPTTVDPEPYARRVRSVVSLSSPHHGSPLASFLTNFLGRELLRVISLVTIYTLRTGRVPIAAVFHLVRLLALPRLPVAAGTLLNQVYRDLLLDFSHERREAIDQFFVDVGNDQELIAQITPSGMGLFNAATRDRPGVRYGSVVTLVPPPGMRSVWTTGLSPFRQATHALFSAFYRITAGMPPEPLPVKAAQATALDRAFGRLPSLRDNDGMVPTLSQVWGDVVWSGFGDHLDALGHFYLPTHVPPHFDWLNSGASFDLASFEGLWTAVARYLLGEAPPERSAQA